MSSLKTLFLLLVLLLIPALNSPVVAKEIESSSKITAVTVFPRGAEIVREVTIDFTAGDHRLVLKDLPPAIVKNSLQVSGKANTDVSIGSVDYKEIVLPLDDGPDKTERQRLMTEIERLRDERDIVRGEMDAAQSQRRLIQELAGLPGQGKGRDNPLKSSDWADLYELIGEKYSKAEGRYLTAKVKIRDLDKRIKNLTQQLATKGQDRKRRTEVFVHFNSKGAGKGQIILTYQIRSASWRPLYEARLQTKAKTSDKKQKGAHLTIIRRAAIEQRSGESWENVRLKMSTSRPGGATAVTKLRPWQVRLIEPYKPKKSKKSGYNQYSTSKTSRPQMSEQDLADRNQQGIGGVLNMVKPTAPKPMIAPIQEPNLTSLQSTYQAVFQVPGKVTVSADGKVKKITIENRDVTPELFARSNPSKSLRAFLYTRFTLKDGLPLLPGPVTLYRDGTYVGRGSLPLINLNKAHELGFGTDDKITVRRVKLDRTKGETGIITTSKIDVQKFKISVQNHHQSKINVLIMDQIPYSENEVLVVSLTSGSKKPTETNVDNKRGLLMWRKKLDPNENWELQFGFQVTWPKDKLIHYDRR